MDIDLTKPPGPNATRDAIHVAVVPLIAGSDKLYSGVTFKLLHGTSDIAMRATYEGDDALGIINPFVKSDCGYFKAGDKVWGILFPGTVTGMTHVWKHPAFDNPPKAASESEQWIRQFADRWNFDYDNLITEATRSSKNEYDRYIVADGIDCHSSSDLGEDHDLFWVHLAVLTGKVYDQDHKDGMGWSCSC